MTPGLCQGVRIVFENGESRSNRNIALDGLIVYIYSGMDMFSVVPRSEER